MFSESKTQLKKFFSGYRKMENEGMKGPFLNETDEVVLVTYDKFIEMILENNNEAALENLKTINENLESYEYDATTVKAIPELHEESANTAQNLLRSLQRLGLDQGNQEEIRIEIGQTIKILTRIKKLEIRKVEALRAYSGS